MAGIVEEGSYIFLEEVRFRGEVLNVILGMTFHLIIPLPKPQVQNRLQS